MIKKIRYRILLSSQVAFIGGWCYSEIKQTTSRLRSHQLKLVKSQAGNFCVEEALGSKRALGAPGGRKCEIKNGNLLKSNYFFSILFRIFSTTELLESRKF